MDPADAHAYFMSSRSDFFFFLVGVCAHKMLRDNMTNFASTDHQMSAELNDVCGAEEASAD